MRIESDILKTIGALVVIGAAFLLAVWMPHRSQMNDIRAQLDARRQNEQVQRAEAAQFSRLQQEVEALEMEFGSLGKSIPRSTDVSPFLAQLGRELVDVALTDSEIQSETVIHGGHTTVIPLTLRIRGSYDQFFQFLRAVESGDRLTRVHDVKIHGTPLKQGEPLFIRLELSTFAAIETGESR